MGILKTTVVLLLVTAVIACGSSDSPSLSPPDQDQIGNLRLAKVVNNLNDGSSIEITTNYDSNNLLTQQVFDYGDDTTTIRQYTYNTARQIATRTDDTDSNGTIEHSYQYFYSATGQLLRREQDADNDGSLDFFQLYAFDNQDQTTGYTINRFNDDGTTTVVAAATHSYALGVLSTIEYDNEPLDDVDTLDEFQYNPDGSVSKVIITSQRAGKSGEDVYTYESGTCDRTWTNSSFNYFCITVAQ